jgi:Phosphate-selective porin O and P.
MKFLKGAALGATVAACLPQAALAANWLQLQGNEPPGVASPVRVFGFLQPTYESFIGNTVEGATAGSGFNGKHPQFDTQTPDRTGTDSFNVLRARIGVRGVATPISDKINYFLLAEFGNNGITHNSGPVVLTDASVTFNYIPGARLRIGRFKYPGPEEALQPIPAVMPYVEFTSVTQQMIFGRDLQPAPAGSPSAPAGAAAAKQIGGVDAFRDNGVQVYDWFDHGPWEYAYAVMVGNGAGLSTTDNNGNKQVTARVQSSYIFGGKGPYRQDVTGWLWYQTGKVHFGDTDYNRMREGLGFKYERDPLRVTAEYMRGTGVIFNGVNPPFTDPNIATVSTVALGNDNKGRGWYVEAGYKPFMHGIPGLMKPLPKLQLEARYDTYDRLPNSATLERRFNTWTLGAQYFFTPRVRVTLNYAIRSLKIGNPAAITNPAQRQNAQPSPTRWATSSPRRSA